MKPFNFSKKIYLILTALIEVALFVKPELLSPGVALITDDAVVDAILIFTVVVLPNTTKEEIGKQT